MANRSRSSASPRSKLTSFSGRWVIRDRNPNTYGDDMRQMLLKRLTFEEAIRLPEFALVSKQRLTIIRRELFEQLDLIEME